eukprot:SAG31_NODE_1176_length_9533_cov_45.120946_3_plen_93_part_00
MSISRIAGADVSTLAGDNIVDRWQERKQQLKRFGGRSTVGRSTVGRSTVRPTREAPSVLCESTVSLSSTPTMRGAFPLAEALRTCPMAPLRT